MQRTLLAGLAAGLLSAAIGAGWQLATRHSTTTTIAALDLTILRYGVPALLLLPFLRGIGLVPKVVNKGRLVFMVLGAGLPFGLLAMSGSRLAPAAHMAVLMAGATPLFAAAFEWLSTRKRIETGRLIGLACIALGVAILGSRAFDARFGDAWMGDLLFLAAAALWVSFTVSFRHSGLSPWQGAALVNAWSALLLLPLFLIMGTPKLFNAPLGDLLFQGLWQGLLAGVLGLAVFSFAVARLGPTGASTFGAIVPVLAGLGGWLLLGENLSVFEVAAISLVTLGVALANGLIAKRLRAPPETNSEERRAV